MAHTQPPSPSSPARFIALVLLAILVAAGAFLRLAHGNWDSGNQLHPDERGILFVAQDIALPGSLTEALSPTRSPANPLRMPDGTERIYAYGHLPLYAMVLAGDVLGKVCPIAAPVCHAISPDSLAGRLLNVADLPRFDHLAAVGRTLSALFDTLTIVATWLLAKELWGKPQGQTAGNFSLWGGTLAAGLCAFAVLHIQNAHFGTVDTALALFTTLCLWLLVRYVHTGQTRCTILAGVCAGLAAGCKASAVLLAFPVAAAYLKWNAQAPGRQKHHWRMGISSKRQLVVTLLAAGLVFALSNPYALLDPVPFLDSLAAQAAMASGALDWPFTRQYVGTLPILYPIEQQARWELGLPLTLAAYGGLAWTIWRAIAERSRGLAVALAWTGAMLVGGGAQLVKFPRYLLPLTPTLFAFAGGMLTIPLVIDQKERRAAGWIRGAAIALIVVPTTLYALAFEAMYGQIHPWVAASDWIYSAIPNGTPIAIEQGDDALPLDLTQKGEQTLAAEHIHACAIDPFAEPDDRAKLVSNLRCVTGTDILIIASNRGYGAIPRLRERYPLTTAYYQALFGGRLGFELVRSFERYPTLLGWSLVDDPFQRSGLPNPLGSWGKRAISLGPADESFTVYDHPLVLVFRNAGHFPIEKLERVIEAVAK
jgi:hypothetical protein